MYKVSMSADTLAAHLKKQSGCEFCTYDDIKAVTSLTYKAAKERLKVVYPLRGKPLLFPVEHAAKAITNYASGHRRK